MAVYFRISVYLFFLINVLNVQCRDGKENFQILTYNKRFLKIKLVTRSNNDIRWLKAAHEKVHNETSQLQFESRIRTCVLRN